MGNRLDKKGEIIEMLKGHGSDTHRYSSIRADFSSNVLWIDYSSVLLPILSKNISMLQHYPDVEYRKLTNALSSFHDLSDKHFLITNGAVAGIYQIAQAFSGAQSHLFFPEFSEYESALSMFNHQIAYSKIEEKSLSDAQLSEGVEFIMLGNPNNPTGGLLEKSKICQFLADRKKTILVIDESYMEFVEGADSMISEIENFPNLIILKSFTKRYSIPGLRLGYIVARPQMIDVLNRWTQPWSVNVLASQVGVEILQHPEKFPLNWNAYRKEVIRFYEALKQIPELEVVTSKTHYFLIRLRRSSAPKLKEYLIKKHGLLIRDASNFRGLNASYFRVSTRSFQENNLLLSALRNFFHHLKKENLS